MLGWGQEWPNTNRSLRSRRSTETNGQEVPHLQTSRLLNQRGRFTPRSGPDCNGYKIPKAIAFSSAISATIPDKRLIRAADDEHRGVQRSFALSGVAGEHVFGPRVPRPRPFLGEIVTLVDGGDTPELCRLVREELIDGDRIEKALGAAELGNGPFPFLQAPFELERY
jgi:hypothetical protein